MIASDCARFCVSGGKSRLVSDLAADDVEGSYEREPVRVEFGGVGCFGHEFSDGVVGEQESPEFLADEFRCFRSESSSRLEELGFDLFEGDLVFPPLLVS